MVHEGGGGGGGGTKLNNESVYEFRFMQTSHGVTETVHSESDTTPPPAGSLAVSDSPSCHCVYEVHTYGAL